MSIWNNGRELAGHRVGGILGPGLVGDGCFVGVAVRIWSICRVTKTSAKRLGTETHNHLLSQFYSRAHHRYVHT